jgi:hypothetical protein
MSQWISRLFSRLTQPRRTGRSSRAADRKQSCRPGIEVLEGRDVPSTFGPFESLAGSAQQVVAVGKSGEQEVFALGSDGAVSYRQQSGGAWGDWQSLGGVASQIAVTVRLDSGKADLFAVGSDGAVWERAQTASDWMPWQTLGGSAKQIAVSGSFADGEHLFAIGATNAVWHRALPYGGTWGSWENLGGWASKITAAPSGPEVFAVGAGNGLWERRPVGGTWSSWTSLGTGLDIAVAGDDVLAIGMDHHVYHRTGALFGSYGAWEDLGGWASQLSVSGADNQSGDSLTDVYALGAGGSVWHDRLKTLQGSTLAFWEGWQNLGGAATQLAGTTTHGGQTDVFALGIDSGVYHSSGA